MAAPASRMLLFKTPKSSFPKPLLRGSFSPAAHIAVPDPAASSKHPPATAPIFPQFHFAAGPSDLGAGSYKQGLLEWRLGGGGGHYGATTGRVEAGRRREISDVEDEDDEDFEDEDWEDDEDEPVDLDDDEDDDDDEDEEDEDIEEPSRRGEKY